MKGNLVWNYVDFLNFFKYSIGSEQSYDYLCANARGGTKEWNKEQ